MCPFYGGRIAQVSRSVLRTNLTTHTHQPYHITHSHTHTYIKQKYFANYFH